MSKQKKYTLEEVKFRRIKEKERMKFYEYAFESTREQASAIGISFDMLKKFCKVNLILLGMPGRILMKNMTDFVTEIEGEIAAGYTMMYSKKKDKYELGNVFTRPKFQGKGLGNVILQRVIALSGNKKIDLSVNKNNETAIHLYQKYGFSEDSWEEEYIGEVPLETIPLPAEYSIRLAEVSDLKNLDRIKEVVPDMKDIDKHYKKSFNKTKKKKLRMENQLPAVLLKKNEIIGIGRIVWTKGAPETAQIAASAFLPEATEAYPCFISFLTEQAKIYGLKKYSWRNNEKMGDLAKGMKSFVGEPLRIGLKMVREVENK